ncbi:putative glycosyltransferase WbgO [Escherichia coli DEC1C]|nr:putative glycosyltransferase WbgO [Escherichia coli DEC1C]
MIFLILIDSRNKLIFKNNPYVDVVGTNAIFIDDKGREINKQSYLKKIWIL